MPIPLGKIRPGQILDFKEEPWKVVDSTHHIRGRASAVLRVQLKNLLTGAQLAHTFQSGDKPELADVSRSRAQLLFSDATSFHFLDQNSFEQFELSKESLELEAPFLCEGQEVDIQLFKNQPISVELPANLSLKVVEAPDATKGDTANSPTKAAKLETGLEIQVPLFVKTGDRVKVDTRTGEYLSRE